MTYRDLQWLEPKEADEQKAQDDPSSPERAQVSNRIFGRLQLAHVVGGRQVALKEHERDHEAPPQTPGSRGPSRPRIVILTHSQMLAGIGVVLWGLGAALGFPVALSAAGDSGPDPDTRVRVAATTGYLAFLVGPPLFGFVGEAVGLRNAM